TGLLEVDVHEGGRRFGLAARLLEEPLVGALSDAERTAMHARALEAWNAWSFAAERPMEALVRHALGAGLPARAVELGGRAARALLARGGLRAAEELAELVLPHTSEPHARAELALLAAEARLRAGRPREARATLASPDAAFDGERAGELRPTRLWILGA